MKASEFDKVFDEGKEDIVDYLDLSTIKRRERLSSSTLCAKLSVALLLITLISAN